MNAQWRASEAVAEKPAKKTKAKAKPATEEAPKATAEETEKPKRGRKKKTEE